MVRFLNRFGGISAGNVFLIFFMMEYFQPLFLFFQHRLQNAIPKLSHF